MGFVVQGIDHVALSVRDQAASESWYRDVFGLDRAFEEQWGDTPIALMARDSGLALFKAREGHAGPLVSHVAFRVDRPNFDAAQADLRQRGIEFEFQDHVASQSIYFEDPDGLRLEITTYEL